MRRVWVMAVIAAAVLVPAAGRAAGYDDRQPPPPAGAVTGVSIRAASGRAEVVVGVDGDVDVQDFALDAPHRIVIDFTGATLKLPPNLYDGIVRGGISNIRVAQFNKSTVRVVLDVDRTRAYRIVRGEHDVLVSLESPDVFAPWSLSSPAVVPAAARTLGAPPKAVEANAVEAKLASNKAFTPVPFVPSASPQQVPHVSVSFRDTPLLEVLAVFSARSGMSIISGSQANSSVHITAEIIDQPWDVAMNNVLLASGLASVRKDPGIIVVDSYSNLRAQLASEPLAQQVVALNYAKAAELAPTIQALLSRECSGGGLQVVGASNGGGSADAGAAAAAGGGLPPGAAMGGGAVAGAGGAPTGAPGQQNISPANQQPSACPPRGSVTSEVTSNKLIIFEVASRIDALVDYVHSFDFKTPQVNIKAKFVSINRTDTKRLGVSYDLGSANAFYNTLAPRTGSAAGQEFQVTLGGDAFAGVANAGRSFKTGSAINLLYNTTIGNFSLTSFIDALTLEELTDVQSEPSVNTVDKKPALLFVGDHISFLLTPPTAAGAIQSAAPQISSIDVGITLNVTPSISANRTVRLTIVAEQSELKQVTIAGPNSTKRQATVEVTVHDGETAVIAGLTQTTVNKTRRGIPLLGQLPMIGRLFSENENIERKDDLLLLITPHILDDPVPPPPGGGH